MPAIDHVLVQIPSTRGVVGLAEEMLVDVAARNAMAARKQALANEEQTDDPLELMKMTSRVNAQSDAKTHLRALRTLIPRREVSVNAFQIDRQCVTNGQYEVFVRETGHRPPGYWGGAAAPDDLDDHPVLYVSHKDALAYALWADLELPTEIEWEIAATGGDGRIYPWGNEPRPELEQFRTTEPGTFPADQFSSLASPFGVRGMVASFWQWCWDAFAPLPGGDRAAFAESYPGWQSTWRVLRGGFSYDMQWGTFTRAGDEPSENGYAYGFRCVKR
jgi:formylglycine-generating enzyme required for sulfatase activity